MSHRLQVLLDLEEYAALQAAARRSRTTVSEYVRQAIRRAREGEPASSVGEKLAVVREAAGHAYPTGDPDVMEAQIRAGYLKDGP